MVKHALTRARKLSYVGAHAVLHIVVCIPVSFVRICVVGLPRVEHVFKLVMLMGLGALDAMICRMLIREFIGCGISCIRSGRSVY